MLVRKILFITWLLSASANAEDVFDLSLDELGNIDIFPSAIWDTHLHNQGEWMIGYHNYHMNMSGFLRGDSSRSSQSLLNDYMATPLDMHMDMHMFHVMYAPSDQLTLAMSVDYMVNSMDVLTRMGEEFTTKSEGVGDLQLTANYLLPTSGRGVWIINGGMIFPTGSTDKKDYLPNMDERKILPYSMQLGSGSYQLKTGLGYMRPIGLNGFGINGSLQSPLDRNNEGYRVGARFELDSWYQHSISRSWTSTLGLNWRWQDRMHGNDDRLNPLMSPTADAENQGGQSINGTIAVEFRPKGFVESTVNLRVDLPMWQYRNGNQLRTRWTSTVSMMIVF